MALPQDRWAGTSSSESLLLPSTLGLTRGPVLGPVLRASFESSAAQQTSSLQVTLAELLTCESDHLVMGKA